MPFGHCSTAAMAPLRGTIAQDEKRSFERNFGGLPNLRPSNGWSSRKKRAPHPGRYVLKEGDQMEKPQKGLSSFQTFWIFGCGVSFFGVILSKPTWIWTGLALLVIDVVAGVLKK